MKFLVGFMRIWHNLRARVGEVLMVQNLKFPVSNNGMFRGFGFVNFESPENAKLALGAVNGSPLGEKVLYIARA